MKRSARSVCIPMLMLSLLSPTLGQSNKQTVFAVLVDNTGSMTTQFSEVLMLADAVVKRINSRGPTGVFSFKRKDAFAVIDPDVQWIPSGAALQDHIHGLSIVRARTALFGAIELVGDELSSKVNSDKASFSEKVLILITDGDDRSVDVGFSVVDQDDRKRRARDQLIKKMMRMGIKVYAIGLTKKLSDSESVRIVPRERAEAFLAKIAKQTGGRAVFPNPKKFDADAVLNELLGP
jgi:hypothetical protein